MPTSSSSCGVRRDLDDEVGVQSGGDTLQDGDSGDNAACLEAGERGLCHVGAGGEVDLRQAKGKTPVANGLANQVSTLSFGVAFAVTRARISRRPGASQ
jgi:hypothetical protein